MDRICRNDKKNHPPRYIIDILDSCLFDTYYGPFYWKLIDILYMYYQYTWMLIIVWYIFYILKSCYLIDTNIQLIYLNVDWYVIYIRFQHKLVAMARIKIYGYILSTKRLDVRMIHFKLKFQCSTLLSYY